MVVLLLSKTYHNKQQRTYLSFSLDCSTCSFKECLKAGGLQAHLSFVRTHSSVIQSNPVPAGGCGLSPRSPSAREGCVQSTKAEARADWLGQLMVACLGSAVDKACRSGPTVRSDAFKRF